MDTENEFSFFDDSLFSKSLVLVLGFEISRPMT